MRGYYVTRCTTQKFAGEQIMAATKSGKGEGITQNKNQCQFIDNIENIDINIDKDILENIYIHIHIHIDKGIWENIDIEKPQFV